jgi:transmembrane sensor
VSGAQQENRPAMNAGAIQAQAAAWLERRERMDWNATDQVMLDAWLAQSPAHTIAYLRIEDVWHRAERLRALGTISPDAPAHAPRRYTVPIVMGIAATLAAIAVIGIAATELLRQPEARAYSTEVGGRELVAFADGTQIELNTDTALRAQMTSQERVVWLDRGEAYFQVKHDPAHPFIVMTGDRRVTDLGTKFLVRRDIGSVEVALLEGRVRVGGNATSHAALLAPGDVATATAESMSIRKKSADDLAGEMAWRRDMLVFNHTTLADAAREINRYNRRKLVIADPSVAHLLIGGTFPKNDVGAITSAARELFKLHIEEHGDEIVISR